MRYFYNLLAALSLMLCVNANAGNLWIVGDATSYTWSLDDATALLSTPENPDVYTGTIYLKADANFKFLTRPDWGGLEYGAADGAVITDGTIALASGSGDSGYAQIKVAESANYYISVDTKTLSAEIRKSSYQDTEIKLCSMFLVGGATVGGWSVDEGTPLYQNEDKPYEYSVSGLELKEGTFKIATVIKGGGSFDQKYFYFRDAADAGKIALNQDGDLQWSISEAGKYDVNVNTLDNTISIKKASTTGIESIIDADADNELPARYYTISGVMVGNPVHGNVYIEVKGTKARKVRF